jgi:hypothetical protein
MSDATANAVRHGWTKINAWTTDLAVSTQDLLEAIDSTSLAAAFNAVEDLQGQAMAVRDYLVAIKAVQDVDAQEALRGKLKAAGHE